MIRNKKKYINLINIRLIDLALHIDPARSIITQQRNSVGPKKTTTSTRTAAVT